MTRGWVAAILTAGALVRLALLRNPSTWYDEATVGLLGLRVLHGDLPVYFFGQPYMGALDGYLAAPVYAVFGPTILTLKLWPALLSIAWMGLVVRIAWLAGGERAGIATALVLVVPPDFLLAWAHEARTHYPLGMVLATLALLLAWRAAAPPWPRAAVLFTVLGFVTGLAFWTTFLAAVFVPAIALVAGRRGLRRLLIGAAVAVPAFLLGSLPHWLYALARGTALPRSGPPIALGKLITHLGILTRVSWPIIAGVPGRLQGRGIGVAVAIGLGVVYLLIIGAGLHRATRPGRLLAWSLVALVAANVAAAVGTDFGRRLNDRDQKYLLPLYTALPPLVGLGLAQLTPRWTLAGALGLALVQSVGVVQSSVAALVPPTATALDLEARAWRAAADRLRRDGPRRLYVTDDPGPRLLTFLSAEQVIISNSYEEILPVYARAVDGAPDVGWWVGGPSPVFEANLRALGVTARRQPVPALGVVYTGFELPSRALRVLDPRRFVVRASENESAAQHVIDRDADTLWGTVRPRRGGEWLQVDLGTVEPVAMVRWMPGTYQEAPTGLRLEASVDGKTWRVLVELLEYRGPLYWSAGHPMGRVRGGRVELRVEPTPARWLRLTQLGGNTLWRWTIRELFVYAAADGPPPPPPPDGPTLARALRDAGVTRLYADHGWGSRVALADPGIRVLPANRFLDAYGREGSARGLWPTFTWDPGVGALVETIDLPEFTAAMTAGGLTAETRSLGPLTLLTPSPREGGERPVPSAALSVTASRRPKAARLALDGGPATRWSTGRPQTAGDWYRITLDRLRPVSGVRLWTAAPMDAPRGLSVDGSEDGVTWRPLGARVRGERPFRWVGIGPLPAGPGTDAVDVSFPPTPLTALRLTLTRGDPVFDWSIYELTVLERP